VSAGSTDRFAIWVWLTSGSGSAKVQLSGKPSQLSPVFTVCPTTGHATCSVQLGKGARDELQAKISVPRSAAGSTVKLLVSATSPRAAHAASVSESVRVKSMTSSSSSPTPTPTGTAGDGASLPPGTLPPGSTLPPGTLPSASVPGLPNPAGTNAASGFPQVLPSPSPSPADRASPRAIQVADASSSLPLAMRLIGGQAIGLAILAAAITITLARLSLRRPRSRRGGGAGPS
jgi:hypothetical protein